jgi:hypothetical protein
VCHEWRLSKRGRIELRELVELVVTLAFPRIGSLLIQFDVALAKYPVKVKTPASVAYEYHTPTNRGSAKSVELTVVEKN